MTETLPFAITFTNNIYELSQPTNGNYVLTVPQAEAVFLTHPTLTNFYYFGNVGYAVTLDYTLCTNLTVASRKAQIDAALALPPAMEVSGSVEVTNFPATQPVSFTQPISVTQSTSPWVCSVPTTVSSTQGTSPWVTSGTVTSNMGIPITADIIGGSRTTTGALVTIPANRMFYGAVSLSCSVSVVGNSQPTISTSGAGVLPLGTLHQIVAVGLALSTVANSNTQNNVFIWGGSAGATVTFTAGASGTSTGQITGRLL